MKSDPEIRRKNIFSVIIAACFTAVLEGILTSVRVIHIVETSTLFAAFMASFLLSLFLFALAGIIVVAASIAFRKEEQLSWYLTFPSRWISGIWHTDRNTVQAAHSVRKIWEFLFASLCAAAVLGFLSYYVIDTFHEPVRMSLLIAAAGGMSVILIFLIVYRLTDVLIRLSGKFFVPNPVITARLSALLFTAVPAASMVYIFIKSDDIFGSIDPMPWVISILFLLAVSLSFCLLNGKSDTGSSNKTGRRFLTFLIPAAVLMISLSSGLGVLAASGETRIIVRTKGAVSRLVNNALSSVLDMDADGFAWLIGGDCHPLDEKSNPLAMEIEGNSYDENCDGRDTTAASSSVEDPLGHMQFPLKKTKGASILFILIDALRADHVSLYGYERKTTPNLDRFSKKAFVFTNFYATGNHTGIAMPSLLTGLFPSDFPEAKRADWKSFVLKSDIRSAADYFNAAGYETVFYKNHKMTRFVRGFRKVNHRKSYKNFPADELSREVIAEVKRHGGRSKKPVLLFAHYMDPHHPYMAHKRPARFGRKQVDFYDAEISYVDESIETLLSMMGKKKYRNWLVIITSDHGEGFYEHGSPHHGHHLYDVEVRVPLVMRVPGLKGREVELTAGHMDLLPTMMQFAGIRIPERLRGRSLLGYLSLNERKDPPYRIVFSETFREGSKYAAHDGRYSLIYDQEANVWKLFNRKKDINQKKNIYPEPRAFNLYQALLQHVRSSSVAAGIPELKKSRRVKQKAPAADGSAEKD